MLRHSLSFLISLYELDMSRKTILPSSNTSGFVVVVVAFVLLLLLLVLFVVFVVDNDDGGGGGGGSGFTSTPVAISLVVVVAVIAAPGLACLTLLSILTYHSIAFDRLRSSSSYEAVDSTSDANHRANKNMSNVAVIFVAVCLLS